MLSKLDWGGLVWEPKILASLVSGGGVLILVSGGGVLKLKGIHAGLPKMHLANSVSTTGYLINCGPSVPLGFKIQEGDG